MGALDFILFFVYGTIIILIARSVRSKIKDKETAGYLLKGLYLKMIGTLGTAVIYWFYYGTGDSIYYFWRIQRLSRIFAKTPGIKFTVLFTSPEVWGPNFPRYLLSLKAHDMSSFILVKIGYMMSPLTFNNYLPIALFFSALCYTGIWALFVKTIEIFPDVKKKYLAYALFFIPSVFFWGSGLFKDTITLGCACWVIVTFHNIFIKRKRIVISLIILVISAYLIGTIKSYILLAMVPAMLLWLTYATKNSIKYAFVRQAITPVFIVASLGLGMVILQQLGSVFTKFNLENIEEKAEGMQRWHTVRGAQVDGSSYSLGHVEFTPTGILRSAPAAINVALFRPYLWEADNPVMLISAVESLIFFGLFFYLVMLRPGFFIGQIGKEPFLMFCLVFTLIFAFSTGFTAYNFGALVRYKIPCLPLFGVLLAVLYSRLKAKKALKAAKKLSPEIVGSQT